MPNMAVLLVRGWIACSAIWVQTRSRHRCATPGPCSDTQHGPDAEHGDCAWSEPQIFNTQPARGERAWGKVPSRQVCAQSSNTQHPCGARAW